MLHGLRLVGRLASSAAVWESRSLPAFSLGVRRQVDRQHTVSHAAWAPFGGPPRKLGGGVGEQVAAGIFSGSRELQFAGFCLYAGSSVASAPGAVQLNRR